MTAPLFHATPEERAAGAVAADELNAVCASIETLGYAVVGGLISPETCALLAASMTEDVEHVRATGKLTPHERHTAPGHLQLGARRYAPYVRPDLVANPLIEQVVSAVLGRGAWLGFYSGNVNCPGSGFQRVHFDRPYAWKTRAAAEADGQSWPPPTTTLSCSVALTDITEETGATEIYPGSHRETAVTEWAPGQRPADYPDLLARWGPPRRMTIPAGGVCFRDPRMWHRGVANRSNVVRPMLALTYHAARARHWRGLLVSDMAPDDVARCEADASLKLLDDGSLGDGRLVFHGSARPAFAGDGGSGPDHGVRHNVRFVDDPKVVNHFLDAHSVGGARVLEGGPIDAAETSRKDAPRAGRSSG